MGNTCGGLREPCLSDTDPRYDPNANFDMLAQDPMWTKSKGLYEFEGTTYHGNGTVMEFMNIELEGVPVFPVSTSNIKLYSNFSIDGTRAIYSSVTLNGPAPFVNVGWIWAGSSYTTSTFELDGRIVTSPYQYVLQGEGVWVDGSVETTFVVSDQATFASADGSDQGESYSQVSTCLDEDCARSTIVNQVYEGDGTLRQFTVYRGARIDDPAVFAERLERAILDFNVPEDLRNHSLVLSNPHAPPNETYWCETMGDPGCSASPYVNPTAGLRTGPLVGFIVLTVVLVAAAIAAAIRRTQQVQADRYRTVFARRVAQTIKIRAGTSRLTPELLKREFETIAENNHGVISKDAMWEFLATGKAGTMDRGDFEALFAVMDVDDNGTIDFLEFCAFLADCHGEYETARDRRSVIAGRASATLASGGIDAEVLAQIEDPDAPREDSA